MSTSENPTFEEAFALHQAGRLEPASEAYAALLRAHPELVEARFNLGNVLLDLGRLDEARESFAQVLQSRPEHPDVLLNLGRVEHQAGNHSKARDCYERALRGQPEFPEAWYNLGMTQVAVKDLDQALSCFTRALAARPEYRNALLGAAYVLETQRKLAPALAMYERLIALQPDDAGVLNAMGVAESALGRHADAVRHLQRALEIDPALVDARYNLGFVHQGRNEYEVALECYDAVLRTSPSHSEAAWGRAISLLGMGDFQRGWPEYEIRHTAKLAGRGPAKIQVGLPMWTGESLSGKRIVLIGEQGAGDQIQFIRYARVLAGQGAEVHVLTDPRLQRLLAGAAGVTRALREFPSGADGFDFWSFLLSVPCRVGTVLESVPAEIPYLVPPEAAAKRWARRLAALPPAELKVGLAWQSGPAAHVWLQYRSASLEALGPLLDVADVSFVGVQFGAATGMGFPGVDLGGEIGDFADHAALLANLDLIITVDTVTAHLGGALGIPTWILLPACADWRWMRERAESPWYPSVSLLRQSRLGDWSDVVARAAERLRELAARKANQGA